MNSSSVPLIQLMLQHKIEVSVARESDDKRSIMLYEYELNYELDSETLMLNLNPEHHDKIYGIYITSIHESRSYRGKGEQHELSQLCCANDCVKHCGHDHSYSECHNLIYDYSGYITYTTKLNHLCIILLSLIDVNEWHIDYKNMHKLFTPYIAHYNNCPFKDQHYHDQLNKYITNLQTNCDTINSIIDLSNS